MATKLATFATFIAGAFVSLLMAQEAAPQRVVIPLAKAKRACTFVVAANLHVFYERALVIAKKEVPAGERDEFWIVFPDRKQSIDSGRVIASNVPASTVLFLSPKDGQVVTTDHGKTCRCPDVLWRGGDLVSAER